jgi:hypothetical protein
MRGKGKGEEEKHEPRARNRSSERIAIEFTRRTETGLSSALSQSLFWLVWLFLVEEQD